MAPCEESHLQSPKLAVFLNPAMPLPLVLDPLPGFRLLWQPVEI
jgi:hypothetical protein